MARINMGGKEVTDFLKKLIAPQLSGADAAAVAAALGTTTNDASISRAKERFGYVAVDYEQELSTSRQNAELDKSF